MPGRAFLEAPSCRLALLLDLPFQPSGEVVEVRLGHTRSKAAAHAASAATARAMIIVVPGFVLRSERRARVPGTALLRHSFLWVSTWVRQDVGFVINDRY